MATIETRKRANGTESYRLTWRYGGKRDGAKQSVTYIDNGDAKRMKGAVEALGHLIYAEDPKVVTFELVTGMKPVTYTAPTFGEIAETYIGSRTRASRVTREGYRQVLNSEVAGLADLVSRPIESITEDVIRRVINDITDRGRSAHAAYDLMRSIFKYAAHRGLLPNGNAAVFTERPKKRGRTANFLTVAEADLLVEKCRADVKWPVIGAALGNLVEVILGTGLRLSEAIGLIVADVHVDDVESAWIDVDKQLSRPRNGCDESRRRVPTKSAAGQRRVVVDSDTARLLARLVSSKRPGDPVFPDPVRGGWWSQYKVDSAWGRARKAAIADGLIKSPRLHDLRHTHAAWLLTDAVPLLAVSRRLGHETISITANIYGHLLPEGDDAIRKVISRRRSAMTIKPVAVAA